GPLDARVEAKELCRCGCGREWTAPWMQGLRQKNSVGAVAVVCPACLLRHMAAGPDGFRDPLPNGRSTLLATTLHGLCGSSDRPISIFPSSPAPRQTSDQATTGRGR